MKVIKILFDCSCGFPIHLHIPVKCFPFTRQTLFSVNCLKCDKKIVVTKKTRVGVLYRIGENNPCVFDYEGEVACDG